MILISPKAARNDWEKLIEKKDFWWRILVGDNLETESDFLKVFGERGRE